MSRWLIRLAELRAARSKPIARVQNVQYVQNTQSTDSFDRAEQQSQPEVGPEISREWCDLLARLDPEKTPRDLPHQRWHTFIADCHRFIEAGWANRANALGWRPHDLFGCDRLRPYARIDRAGLLWLLCGRKLIALAPKTAVVEAETGARQTYYRNLADVSGVVLAWELDE